MEKKRANAVVTMEQREGVLVFKVLGGGEIELNMQDLHPDVLARAAVHGLKQRISDAAAIPCDPETGKPARPSDKFAAIEALVRHYASGTADWNRVRASGEGASPNGGKVLTAINNVYAFGSIEKAREVVEKTAAKQGIEYKAALALWRKSDKIAAELVRMAGESAKGVNADDLLNELG